MISTAVPSLVNKVTILCTLSDNLLYKQVQDSFAAFHSAA